MNGARQRRWLAAACLAIALLPFSAGRSYAMGLAPCGDPFLFSGAAVNAVVLPFRHSTANGEGELSEAGRELASLVHLEVLLSLIKYQSVGAVVLRKSEPEEECNAIEVLEGLTPQLTAGHGLILIWGRLFEQEDQVYVQTYARFVRGERDETFEFALADSEEPAVFRAPMPATSLTFAPRRLSRDDIASISADYREATLVRPYPNDEAGGEPLHDDPEIPFAYSITNIEDGWMFVEHRDGAQKGWIRARGDDTWPLRSRLPELFLIDAIAGHLRLRAAEAEGVARAPSRTAYYIGRATSAYQEFAGEAEPGLTKATALVLQGLSALRAAESPARSIDGVSGDFNHAVAQAPSDSLTRNFAAVAPALRYAYVERDEKHARETVSMLLDALSLDPGNAAALGNLEMFYRYLRDYPGEAPAYTARDLDERLAQIARIRPSSDE